MTVLLYPLEVLYVNRMLEEQVPRSGYRYFPTITRELFGLAEGGVRSIFRGFMPHLFTASVRFLPLFVASAGYKDPLSQLATVAGGTLVANPLEVLTTRYQNVNFQRQSIFKDLKEAGKTTNLWRVGLTHAFARNFIMAAILFNYKMSVGTALLAGVLSHPFEILRARAMWAAQSDYYPSVSNNPLKGVMAIYQGRGIEGLFRGFVPRMAIFLLWGLAGEPPKRE